MKSLWILGTIALLGGIAVIYREAWSDWAHHVTAVVQVGAVVSLVLALYQLGQVGKTNQSLLDISESMSTKFVGKFPDHIPEITRLIRTAKKNVIIVCDLLGYGYYSSPHQYQQYRSAVLGLSPEVDVRIAIYAKERASLAAREQLGESFDEIVASDTYKTYLEYYNIEKEDEPKNTEEFYARWEWNYEKHYTDFNIRQIVIHKVRDKSMPMYFWIVDDRVAVFSFPSLSIEPPEVAFKTSDRNLIEIFKRILVDVDPVPMNMRGGRR